jgi:DHA1 family multidrug resistance protein-like MFS transporter
MPLTEEDYENLRAEANAEPERFRSWDPNERFRKEYAGLHPENQERSEAQEGDGRREEEIERLEQIPTATSSSSSAVTSGQYEGIRARPAARPGRSGTSYSNDTEIHRSETHRINGRLETHPTALDRINTHRSQHFGTVGSRASTKKKETPLPNFGGGKPYPPALPAQEEYVVEFDGPDDPSHAQNWPLKKKFAVPIDQ